MKTIELKKPSLPALLSLMEEQPAGLRSLYRGHANASWKLVPSLFRIKELARGGRPLKELYDSFEEDAVFRFFNEGLPYLPAIQRSFANDRILAQHFGVPTRLLDWTNDPFVATFFAVENLDVDADAAVYLLLPDAEGFPLESRDQLEMYNTVAIIPPAIDRRIPAQKSVFTFHPYGPPEGPFVALDDRPDMGNKSGDARVFVKIVIKSWMKAHLRSTLLEFGVDRRNLFPGLDGVGSDIMARSRSGHL